MNKNHARFHFRIPRLSYRIWLVWLRNFDVFMKTYMVNFIPPLVEPLFYLVGLGFGLAGLSDPRKVCATSLSSHRHWLRYQ